MPVSGYVSASSAAGKVQRSLLIAGLAALLLAISAVSASDAAADTGDRATGRYIVLFKDSVDHPGTIARAQVEQREGRIGFVYRHALKGYSAILPKAAIEGLRADPRVTLVAPDREAESFAQTMPTGIDRTFASGNEALDIDGEDDLRVNVDVAVIDTGIDYEHPDLDVVARTYCNGGESAECVDNTGTDSNGHGTHVAGTVGAIDNNEGVVGIAPGARLWAVKVLDPSGFDSEIAAGVDWVTGHAEEIEVANMSLGCACALPATAAAIEGSVEAGIVYTVAAGNAASNASGTAPANHPDVITVSGLADYNGQAGGGASPTCSNQGADDSSYTGSNWGSTIEIAAPGVCILSTIPGGEYYGNIWGTSMASPHVAGAAAILAGKSNPESQSDVEAIRSTIVEEGNFAWTDTSKDGVQEPLLDLSNEAVFGIEEEASEPPSATTEAATNVTASGAKLHGTVNPNGANTTYQFEYGTTISYGSLAPASPKGIGSGVGGVAVSETIGGLEPETTYHFRVIATNGAGTVEGEDKTFVTSEAPEVTDWEIQPSLNPSEAEESEQAFTGVGCNANVICMASGAYANPGGSGPLVEVWWEGAEWLMASTSGMIANDSTCVVFGGGNECGALGSKEGQVWAQRWAKPWGWVTMTTPVPSEASSSEFRGAGCAPFEAKLECWGVGKYVKSGEDLTVAMRWEVATQKFVIFATPNEGEGSVLNDVSCNVVGSCVAVGYFLESGEKRPLAAHWNGTTWSMKAVPNSEAGGTDTYLNDVSCTGAGGGSTRCIAVGANEGGSPQVAVSMHWNGEEWSEVAPEAPAGLEGDFRFDGVSCISTAECYAVGRYATGEEGSETRTLAEEWDGSEWAISSSPNAEGHTDSWLSAVSCVLGSGGCLAVGGAEETPTKIDTLAMSHE